MKPNRIGSLTRVETSNYTAEGLRRRCTKTLKKSLEKKRKERKKERRYAHALDVISKKKKW